MTDLTDKVVIVTGAASGIGKAIAARLIADGARVAVTDINEAGAVSTAAELGERAFGVRVDVTSRESVDASVASVIEHFGGIDVLVNNAGWDKAEPFIESEVSTWERVIAINLYGQLHMTQAVLPTMIEQRSGSIINLGSDAARVGSSGEAVYSATKGGIVAFTKTIAREMARYQVRANAVCPGPADTPLFASIAADSPKLRDALERSIPLRRLAQPEDLANAVAFFADEASAYITGQTLSVSGGLTMI